MRERRRERDAMKLELKKLVVETKIGRQRAEGRGRGSERRKELIIPDL
jgi:hypothetical protein